MAHYKINCIVKSDGGVAATEFALIAPILIFLMLAMFEFGMYMNNQMKVENLSRSVVEYVINGGDVDDAWADVVIGSNQFSDPDTLGDRLTLTTTEICMCNDDVEFDCDTGCGGGDYRRKFIDVKMQMNYTPMIPYPGTSADNLVMFGNARMQIE